MDSSSSGPPSPTESKETALSAKPKRKTKEPGRRAANRDGRADRFWDVAAVSLFLALTFVLGVFRQRDMDIWWHLKTGRWMREHLRVPREDIWTFGASGRPWIDLHWGFEVLASLIYEKGGMPALQFAKCGVTATSLAILIASRKRSWPWWSILLAWIPALILLSGRMYVRPETVTLLWLSIFLAVLFRMRERPGLLWILPFVQILWVNTQGLFILGPIVLTMALVDAALNRRRLAEEGKKRRGTVWAATAATLAACLANPYFLEGALFPLRLAETMTNPVFAATIAELTPIPIFLKRYGSGSFMLRLHFFVGVLGGLSFLTLWAQSIRAAIGRRSAAQTDGKGKKTGGRPREDRFESTRVGMVFRLLLYVTFGLLSLRATRNSHQFAAVVGAVTAWNFGEAAAIANRFRFVKKNPKGFLGLSNQTPRIATTFALIVVLILAASGVINRFADEGRTIGWGEERLWHPHAAAKFAGSPGMPDRLIAFHLGDAGLYEFYHGPKRKPWVDPRLEVMGADLYEAYLELEGRLNRDDPGWERRLVSLGSPAILTDNAHQGGIATTLLAHSSWPCVWFDPIATVFAPRAVVDRGPIREVDFLSRHFRPDPDFEPDGTDAVLAEAKALAGFAEGLRSRPSASRRLIPLGLDRCRRILRTDRDSIEAWKTIGRLEAARVPLALNGSRSARTRLDKPFDPVLDLAYMKSVYRFARVLEIEPEDSVSLLMLSELALERGFDDFALPSLQRLSRLDSDTSVRKMIREKAKTDLERIRKSLGPEPERLVRPSPATVERETENLLSRGRALAAADLIELQTAATTRSWAIADLLGTLRLNMGRPDLAREIWRTAKAPRDSLRSARIGATWLVEGDDDQARECYLEAIAEEPDFFEALYALAALEFDAGRASRAFAFARKAETFAPGTSARSVCRRIVEETKPYVDKH